VLRITNQSITRDQIFKEFRRCKDIRLKERLHVILLCFDGLSAPQISAILYRDVETVRDWIKGFNKKGFFGLKSKTIPGSPGKMDSAKRDLLKKI